MRWKLFLPLVETIDGEETLEDREEDVATADLVQRKTINITEKHRRF